MAPTVAHVVRRTTKCISLILFVLYAASVLIRSRTPPLGQRFEEIAQKARKRGPHL